MAAYTTRQPLRRDVDAASTRCRTPGTGTRAARGGADDNLRADVWTEHVHVRPGTEVAGRFADGPASEGAALTRRRVGDGTAWYRATVTASW